MATVEALDGWERERNFERGSGGMKRGSEGGQKESWMERERMI
jgi:hypothetical protein